MLSSQYAREKEENRAYLMQILSSICFLARQGLALQGDNDSDSNMHQLLLLRAIDNPKILSYLEKKKNKFTSPDIQNELINIMAQQILREIISKFQSKYYAIMIDEATDASNSEQVVIVFRWVNESLDVHEGTESTTATTLVALIKDVLTRCNLNIKMCRGQCYDGASVMTGLKNGVSTTITKDENRAVFTHCYGHSLNLAMNDTIKKCKLLKSALEVPVLNFARAIA